MSLVFRPLGILSGALGGIIATQLFERTRSLVAKQGPPVPNDRHVGLASWLRRWPSKVRCLSSSAALPSTARDTASPQ